MHLKECENLKTINFPKSTKYIKNNAFKGCLKLKSVFIYNSILVEDAFDNNTIIQNEFPENIFQVKFKNNMFKELFDLGPKECGPICLNTMEVLM